MLSGKTQTGVDIKSTYGMHNAAPIRWALLADAARATIFEIDRDKLITVADLYNADGKRKERSLASDAPGRAFDSRSAGRSYPKSSGSHTYATEEDFHRRSIHLFAKRIANLLEKRRTQFDSLVILADPKFLGFFNRHAPSGLVRTISAAVEKNIMGRPIQEIERQIREIL